MADLDLTGLHRLRHLALQANRQQPVAKIGTFHPDVVSKLEPPLERTTGNAAVEIFALQLFGFAASDNQDVALLGDIEIALAKTRHRHRDTIVVFAGLDDVIGRPSILR